MSVLSVCILVFLLFHYVFKYLLSKINFEHLKRKSVSIPPKWQSIINLDSLSQTIEYSGTNLFWNNIQNFVGLVFTIIVLYSGILPFTVDRIIKLDLSNVVSGLLFIFLLAGISYVIEIPFSLIHDFVTEKKFGFSTITFKTWLFDQLKAILLSILLGGILISAILLLIEKTGDLWWIYVWGVINSFQLLISFLFPVVFAPLFYKFEHLEDEELNKKIVKLANIVSFPLSGVYQIDASKRSTHSNAFFAGFGKTRRVALFDTLIKQHSHDEILAILAHEIAHWKKGHIIKGFVLNICLSALVFYSISLVLNRSWFYDAFGLLEPFKQTGVVGAVAGAGLFLTGILFSPVSFVLSPITSWLSRKNEYEADALSLELYKSDHAMEDALLKLSEKNLSNIFPHPLYVLFNYSHPSLLQRIEALKKIREQKNL